MDKYIEAIKCLKEIYPTLNKGDKAIVDKYNFPELAESEDEKIRKALIHLVRSNKETHFGIENYDGVNWDDILSWLEKLMPADKMIQSSKLVIRC